MFRNLDFKMVVFFSLMILSLLMIAFFVVNFADGYAASHIGDVVGVCDTSCTTSG